MSSSKSSAKGNKPSTKGTVTGAATSSSSKADDEDSCSGNEDESEFDCAQRKLKNEKERGRRENLNVLFTELSELLGVSGQNKAQILANAKEFLIRSHPRYQPPSNNKRYKKG
jgi:hypothetical protein